MLYEVAQEVVEANQKCDLYAADLSTSSYEHLSYTDFWDVMHARAVRKRNLVVQS
jgi:hypothetical protein